MSSVSPTNALCECVYSIMCGRGDPVSPPYQELKASVKVIYRPQHDNIMRSLQSAYMKLSDMNITYS